jgi:hypothetical protein
MGRTMTPSTSNGYEQWHDLLPFMGCKDHRPMCGGPVAQVSIAMLSDPLNMTYYVNSNS